MAVTESPRWATPAQVAQHLGVSAKTVRNWIARGDLVAYRTGPRLIRIDLNQVDRFMVSGEIPNARTVV